MINLEKYIKPLNKILIYLFINLYYPWFLYFSFKNLVYAAENEDFGRPDLGAMFLLALILYTLVPYYVVINLIITFSYNARYKNLFLIISNIFLLIILSLWSVLTIQWDLKLLILINLFLYILWFYLLVSLIIDLKNKPINPKKLW